MPLVFVYGTLKRGFPLFEQGLAEATYLGPGRTVEPYPLYIAKEFYGPVMLDRPGQGQQVYGELFEVPEDRMSKLDELEAVGLPGSFRSIVQVEPASGGIRNEAVGFMKDESWLEPLHSDCITDYQDRRFVPPWWR